MIELQQVRQSSCPYCSIVFSLRNKKPSSEGFNNLNSKVKVECLFYRIFFGFLLFVVSLTLGVSPFGLGFRVKLVLLFLLGTPYL